MQSLKNAMDEKDAEVAELKSRLNKYPAGEHVRDAQVKIYKVHVFW